MIVGNEDISPHEASGLIRMLLNDARQMAGVFHGMNRSAKFRANFPDEYVFADNEWRNFVEATLQLYSQEMGNPKRSEADKRRMFLARLLWASIEQDAPEHYGGNQIMPNSEAFMGDKRENQRLTGMFGKHAMTFHDLAMGHKRLQ